MAANFELYKDKVGDYRFRLKSGNGEIVLVSEGYKSRASAENGIESVRKNASSEAHYERKESKNGKLMFNIKATNGQVVGTSEMYDSESARDAGIQSAMNAAANAGLIDQTA